jgi:hypothetical protein
MERLRLALMRFGMRRALLLLLVALACLMAVQCSVWLSQGLRSPGLPASPPTKQP